jgi:hypothetical protein
MQDEPLGSKRIAGVDTIGRRIRMVVPPGYRWNDKWIEMVDERWESADLQLLVKSWHSDSMGTIEYQLANIRRTEQAAHLFELPVATGNFVRIASIEVAGVLGKPAVVASVVVSLLHSLRFVARCAP